MEAKNGEALAMKCKIPANKPLKLRSVRWAKKDFHYADLLPPLEKAPHYTVGNNGDLYFSYVTSADTGSYVCVVGNTILGKSEKRTVKLKVGLSQGKEINKTLSYKLEPPKARGCMSDTNTEANALYCIACETSSYSSNKFEILKFVGQTLQQVWYD
jgi:hypothetical protein